MREDRDIPLGEALQQLVQHLAHAIEDTRAFVFLGKTWFMQWGVCWVDPGKADSGLLKTEPCRWALEPCGIQPLAEARFAKQRQGKTLGKRVGRFEGSQKRAAEDMSDVTVCEGFCHILRLSETSLRKRGVIRVGCRLAPSWILKINTHTVPHKV